MKSIFSKFTNEIMELMLPGKRCIRGTVIETGNDILVLFNGEEYVYLPLQHIKQVRVMNPAEMETEISEPAVSPALTTEEELSFRKVLMLSKGTILELGIANSHSLYGYVHSIMNNYIVFHSFVHKTMYIPMQHIKWLIPCISEKKPYGLPLNGTMFQTSSLTLARTFDVQLEKLKGRLIVLNTGNADDLTGRLNAVEGSIAEIETARNKLIYFNIQHLKSVHEI